MSRRSLVALWFVWFLENNFELLLAKVLKALKELENSKPYFAVEIFSRQNTMVQY